MSNGTYFTSTKVMTCIQYDFDEAVQWWQWLMVRKL